jgi:hypothetical protein
MFALALALEGEALRVVQVEARAQAKVSMWQAATSISSSQKNKSDILNLPPLPFKSN